MDKATRKCPYCGGEILSVAKKCKHCGEWLKSPAEESNKRFSMFKNPYFTRLLYGTTIAYCLVSWFCLVVLLNFISRGFFIRGMWGTIMLFVVAIAFDLGIVWHGLKNCTSTDKTISTVRYWLTSEIVLLSMPFSNIVELALIKFGIFTDDYGQISDSNLDIIFRWIPWLILIVFVTIAAILWRKKSADNGVSIDNITKRFTMCTGLLYTLVLAWIYIS